MANWFAVGTGGSGNPSTYIDFGTHASARWLRSTSPSTAYGKTLVEFGSTTTSWLTLWTLQTDGKIVVTAPAEIVGGGDDFAIVRLNTDGSIDNTFSGDGRALTTSPIVRCRLCD